VAAFRKQAINPNIDEHAKLTGRPSGITVMRRWI
jgi:hypothetical protein